MVTWLPIVMSVAAALICGLAVDVYGWEAGRLWLIPALSIIAAAVLVRLARGVPLTNPDHVRAEEVNEVTGAFTALIRALRSLFFVVLGTTVLVGAASPVAAFLSQLMPASVDYGNRAGSALVGLSVGYCFARMLQIAQSDVSIANLQARLLREAVARREAKTFEAEAMQPSSFRQPEGYGKPLQ